MNVISLLYKTLTKQIVLVSPTQETELRKGTEKGNSNDSEDGAKRESNKAVTLQLEEQKTEWVIR